MAREKVAQLLKEKLAELERPQLQVDGSPAFLRWRQEVEAVLRNYFKDGSDQLKNFKSASMPVYPGYNYLTESKEDYRKKCQAAHEEMLPKAKAALEAIIFEVEKFDFPALGVEPTELPQDSLDDERTIRAELEEFRDGFARYKRLLLARKSGRVTPDVKTELQNLSSELPRMYGRLKPVIEEHGGPTEVLLQGGTYRCEAFTAAFSPTGFSREALLKVMDTAIAAIDIAIGNLESLMLPETGQVQAPDNIAEVANYLFDNMQFHPKVVEASKSRFESGHYSDAIFAAFKAVNNFVKQKTGLALDGKGLMMEVFSKNNPIIKLNEGRTDSDKDEQEGFMHLFAGAMQGIRNPKAHDEVAELNTHKTLEYLGFASLLMRRAEEGKVKRPRKKRAKSTKS